MKKGLLGDSFGILPNCFVLARAKLLALFNFKCLNQKLQPIEKVLLYYKKKDGLGGSR